MVLIWVLGLLRVLVRALAVALLLQVSILFLQVILRTLGRLLWLRHTAAGQVCC